MQVVDDYTFRLILDQPYYPALQELALIRPVRFLSPKHLPQRPDQKSCPTNAPVFWPSNVTEFTCVPVAQTTACAHWPAGCMLACCACLRLPSQRPAYYNRQMPEMLS